MNYDTFKRELDYYFATVSREQFLTDLQNAGFKVTDADIRPEFNNKIMPTKQEQINEDIKIAMKLQEPAALRVLRSLKSAFTNAALNKGNVSASLSDNDVIVIIRKQISQRLDSIEQFTKGGRVDLVLSEEAEIAILKQYLPKELTAEEVDSLIAQALTDTGAVSKRDMGKAIKRAVELAEGRVDNKLLSGKIGNLLT